MSANCSAEDIVELLADPSTEPAQLRAIAEAHELNPRCGRQCETCLEFFEQEFSHEHLDGLRLYFIGDAIVSHPQCDHGLRGQIRDWVYEQRDGEWSQGVDEAIVANPNCPIELIETHGQQTTNPFELLLIKHHPKLTAEIATTILTARGWKTWPTDDFLSSGERYFFNDEDALGHIQA